MLLRYQVTVAFFTGAGRGVLFFIGALARFRLIKSQIKRLLPTCFKAWDRLKFFEVNASQDIRMQHVFCFVSCY
jgi:hypothetical protein